MSHKDHGYRPVYTRSRSHKLVRLMAANQGKTIGEMLDEIIEDVAPDYLKELVDKHPAETVGT